MEFLDFQFLGNTIQSWITALGSGIGVYLLLRLLRWIIRRQMASRFADSTYRGVGLVKRFAAELHGIFLLALAVWIGAGWLTLPAFTANILQIAIMLIGLYQAGLLIVAVLEYMIDRRIKVTAKDDPARRTTINALGIVAKIAVWTFIILIGLDNLPNVDITSLIAGLGIGGIAVGLAMQNILADLFSSLTIALDKPFVIGDAITVGDFTGTVEHIGLKSTRLRSISGEQLVFSNSDLLSSRIRNFKRMEERVVVFTLQVDFDTPPEKVELIPQMIKEVIEPQEAASFIRAYFQSFTDKGLQFEVVYRLKTADFDAYTALHNTINYEVFRRFKEQGIRLARPLVEVSAPAKKEKP